MKKYIGHFCGIEIITALFVYIGLISAKATTYQWNTLGPVTSPWSNTANWQGGLAPTSTTSADILRFYANNYNVVATGNVHANADIPATPPMVLNQFILSGVGNTATAYSMYLTGSAIQLAGTNPKLVLEAGNGGPPFYYNLANNIQLTGTTNITNTSYAFYYITSIFSGAGPLTIDGSKAQINLYGASTYTGTTTFNGGIVYLGANNVLPAAGDLVLNSPGTIDLNTPYAGSAGGNETVASLAGTGKVTNNNNSTTHTLTISGTTDTTFSGAITSGSGSTPNTARVNVVKNGTSILTLSGTGNTYTGTTTINGGVLEVTGTLAATPITVNAGGTLAGNATLTSTVTLSGGAISPDGVDTLTTGTETWGGGARVEWTMSDSGMPSTGVPAVTNSLAINGNLTISATASNPVVIDLWTLAGTTDGPAAEFNQLYAYDWKIASATGTITGFASNLFAINTANFLNPFSINNIPSGAFSIKLEGASNNEIHLVYTPSFLPPLSIIHGSQQTPATVPVFETWLGRPVPEVNTYYDSQPHWADWLNNIHTFITSRWQGTRWQPVLSVAMMPDDSNLAAGASKTYNSNWTTLANDLVAAGMGSITLRIGWEMNLNNGVNYPWTVKTTTDAGNFSAYWIQIVTTMQAVPGANFKFDFCPGIGAGNWPVTPDQYYPGDAYVDYIGLDVYDKDFTAKPIDPDQRWNNSFVGNTTNFGLTYWYNFANTHHKQTSFPEWGVGGTIGSPQYGALDDPFFMRQMYNWISTSVHNVAYHQYWDTNEDYQGQISGTVNPSEAVIYKDSFGAAQYWDQDIGSVTIPGTSTPTYTTSNTGTTVYTISGSGSGIGGGIGGGGTTDSFHFTFTPKMGDCTVVARVTAIQNTSSNAMVGVMVREDMTAGGRYVLMGLTQGGNVVFQYRDPSGGAATNLYTASGVNVPLWIKLVRQGNVFTGYRSSDGATWTSVGSEAITMNANSYMGLASAGISSTQLNSSTVDNFNVPIEIIQTVGSSGVTTTGTWTTHAGTWVAGVTGASTPATAYPPTYESTTTYNTGNYVTFTPSIPESGNYNIYVWYPWYYPGTTPATNVPVTVTGSSVTASVDESLAAQSGYGTGYFSNGSAPWYWGYWHPIGTYALTAGTGNSVKISTVWPDGTTLANGPVTVNAVRFYRAR